MIIKEKNQDITFVEYIDNVLPPELYDNVFNEVNSYDDWKHGKTKKDKIIDRQQKWYHHDEQPFCKVWKNSYDRWLSHKYTQILKETEEYINGMVNQTIPKDVEIPKYNSILINKYQDGSCFIPRHKDNSYSFGETPTIALLSLGCDREFVLKNIHSEYSYTLKDNSLLIMAGCSQKYYTHELLEDLQVKDCRYSLSFREHKH
jgi:alkylated DNA repair dioxygenase AlkB